MMPSIARISALLLLAGMLSVSASVAGIPATINFQGVLEDDQGTPLEGTYYVTFALYTLESGGSALWSEAVNIECENGLFNAALDLGSSTGLDFSQQYWLGVTMAGESEMIPRYKLTSVPYAMYTATADTCPS